MRDPNRIPRMIELLERYWTKYPDLRLAQIVGNMARRPDPYYVEDDTIESELTAALNADVMRVGDGL